MQWLAGKRRLPPPDVEFGYSNSGYVVLAELVERVAQEPFAKFLIESVICGIDSDMDSTYVFDSVYGFAPDDPETANHARCYNRVGDRLLLESRDLLARRERFGGRLEVRNRSPEQQLSERLMLEDPFPARLEADPTVARRRARKAHEIRYLDRQATCGPLAGLHTASRQIFAPL